MHHFQDRTGEQQIATLASKHKKVWEEVRNDELKFIRTMVKKKTSCLDFPRAAPERKGLSSQPA